MTHEHSSDAEQRRDFDPFSPSLHGIHSSPDSLGANPPANPPIGSARGSARTPAHDIEHRSFSGDDVPSLRASEPNAAPAGALRSTDAESPTEAPGDAGLARPRRRRGSRGGRRRRGRRHGASAQPGESREPFDPSSAPDDAPRSESAAHSESGASARTLDESRNEISLTPPSTDAGAHPGRRKRRGRRGRGRRRDGSGRDPQASSEAHDSSLEPRSSESERHHRPSDRSGSETRGEVRAHEAERRSGVADHRGNLERGTQHGDPRGMQHAPGTKKRRRRGGRGGRNRGERFGPRDSRFGGAPMAPVEVETIPGEDDDLPVLPDLPEEAEVLAAPREEQRGEAEHGRRSRRKKRGGKRREELEATPEIESDDEAPKPEPVRNALILVNAADPEEQRVAVIEDGEILDFQMTVRTENSVVNDIYRGRVVNLEPAIGAAFVDFGQGRNGFLHTSDVLSAYGDKDWSLDKLLTTTIDPEEWDSGSSQPSVGAELSEEESKSGEGEASKRKPKRSHPGRFRARPRLPITDLLKKGEMVVVQVTKDAIGDKGPTLTTYISIPGRYLVLMPSMSRTGVSRKIEDEKERRRLKRILQQLEVPPGMGVIVRTAGVGHSRADLKRDLDYLKGAWEAFGKRLRSGHGPAPLYQESDVAIRTVRDLFTPGTEAVIVDDSEVHRQIVEFTKQLMPENQDRVKLHTGPRPLFHTYGVEPDFERILARRIELPSGGSIVFDQAEALVAIDVNSGRTRSDSFDFEEIALKTNLEAAPEIARQIRLRDLGGIIVVDFIDMMRMANIRAVERKFKEALEDDRARSKVGRISQFGLLELTRQRLGPGMSKKVFHTCPRCRGTGRVRTVESRAAAILRRLGSAMTLKGFSTVEVRAHPEVIAYLKDSCNEYLRAFEYRFERQIKLYDAPEQAEDSVLRYLRTDGREVRPGGRRKR
jgi:ribonuclease E